MPENIVWVLVWCSKQPAVPLHTTSQKKRFWIPRMGVFELHYAKNIVWVLGWRSKHPYLCRPQARTGVFGYLGWVSLNCTMPQNIQKNPNKHHACMQDGGKQTWMHVNRMLRVSLTVDSKSKSLLPWKKWESEKKVCLWW